MFVPTYIDSMGGCEGDDPNPLDNGLGWDFRIHDNTQYGGWSSCRRGATNGRVDIGMGINKNRSMTLAHGWEVELGVGGIKDDRKGIYYAATKDLYLPTFAGEETTKGESLDATANWNDLTYRGKVAVLNDHDYEVIRIYGLTNLSHDNRSLVSPSKLDTSEESYIIWGTPSKGFGLGKHDSITMWDEDNNIDIPHMGSFILAKGYGVVFYNAAGQGLPFAAADSQMIHRNTGMWEYENGQTLTNDTKSMEVVVLPNELDCRFDPGASIMCDHMWGSFSEDMRHSAIRDYCKVGDRLETDSKCAEWCSSSSCDDGNQFCPSKYCDQIKSEYCATTPDATRCKCMYSEDQADRLEQIAGYEELYEGTNPLCYYSACQSAEVGGEDQYITSAMMDTIQSGACSQVINSIRTEIDLKDANIGDGVTFNTDNTIESTTAYSSGGDSGGDSGGEKSTLDTIMDKVDETLEGSFFDFPTTSDEVRPYFGDTYVAWLIILFVFIIIGGTISLLRSSNKQRPRRRQV